MDMAGIELPKQEEEDEVVEQDPDGRYYRYNEVWAAVCAQNMGIMSSRLLHVRPPPCGA